ncbi:TPA: YxeA family protein [Staphylococcus aureus]|nr:YxeA family protein [Staphylococcus aureus]UFA57484.1 YxeA family protein [Staphylococcus aureus]HDD0209280.1 YxeA family protein [Staphylococcus aureus]HDD0303932.1 YxeA family protein [Staphylococcus aureus]HDD0308548.1 YxeA family protein [Staphylococcus aureus]HDD0309464.1 YxeA family protein [Staphylococcus aureus]
MTTLLLIGYIFLVLLVAAMFSAFATKNSTGEFAGIIDRYNPIVHWDDSYIKTTEPTKEGPYGTAIYNVTGTNDEGKTRSLEFLTPKILKQDRYLKIKHKGAYVETYEEVKKDDLPKKVRKKLE